MKKLRLVAFLLLLVLAISCMFACGGGNKEQKLTLVNNDGSLNFTVVLGDKIEADVRFKFVNLKSALKKMGVELELINYDDPEAEGVEVLVGTVTTRGEEYVIDRHSLGHEGYAVELIKNKIVINGGTKDALITAVDYFIEEILLFDEDRDELSSAVMSESQNKKEIFTEYDITSFKVGDVDLKKFKIVVDTSDFRFYPQATVLRDAIYDESGIYLDIVSPTETVEHGIYIREVAPDNTAKDSFRVHVKDGDLYIECEYYNRFDENFERFVLSNITTKDGDIAFKGSIYTADISYLTYEQFGANGYDENNDFNAIYKAHEQANLTGMTLKIDQNATYYITDTSFGGAGAKEIKITTDVYWGTAKFVIYDKDLTPDNEKQIHDDHIFSVVSDKSSFKIDQSKIDEINAKIKAGTLAIGPGTKKLDLGLGYKVMLEVTDVEKRIYIRYGANANTGNVQHELIIIDENGNIEPTTSFLLDYAQVTEIRVYPIDDKPITIDGGHFTTVAPDYNTDAPGAISDYYDRGISFQRSNLTVKNIYHDVTNQKAYGEKYNPGWDPIAYHGFYSFGYCNNVTMENCTMTARAGHGTYDFSANMTNNLTAKDCKMTNFFLPDEIGKKNPIASVQQGYWGVMGSSYCKNTVFDGCQLTRFDAHAGVYNAKILNSEVALINIIGGGEMLIQNSTIYYHRLIELRSDYGATWKGDIKIYNCKVNSATSNAPVVEAVWANHDFGYVCYFPNIEIRDLEYINISGSIPIFRNPSGESLGNDRRRIGRDDDMHLATLKDGTANTNIMVPPQYIKVTSNAYNITFVMPKLDMFKDTDTTGIEVK